MRKILSTLLSILFITNLFAQPYFQGTFLKDAAYATNNKIIFRMNPTASITTSIAYMEFAFRYPTASVTSISINNISTNTTTFPGLNIQRLLPDYVSGGFTYVRFVHNTATVPSNTYVPNANGFDVFTITTSGSPATLSQIDMSSEVTSVNQNFNFAVLNGAGVLIDPGTGNQLYGPGFNIDGDSHLLPLDNIVLPVKFTSFNATKKDNDGLLKWTVENETSNIDYYEVQRSLDGITFDKIGILPKDNNSATTKTYNSIDANLYNVKKAGLIYYRVKQVDLDGRFVYSDIRYISLDNKLIASLYPNPARDYTFVKINAIESGTVFIDIYNEAGAKITSNTITVSKGENIKKIDTHTFTPGNYIVKIKNGSTEQISKLIKL